MRKIATVLAVAVLLAVIVIGIGRWLNPGEPRPPAPPGQTQSQPVPTPNPPGCPAYEIISAPGTWESSKDDDPFNPTANPRSFMLSISNPLKQEFTPDQLKVWTLPYTAQFRNFNSMGEMSYDASRQEGYARMSQELAQMHSSCPATRFIIAGFSQGAVISGDMAAEIGNGNGPVPAEMIAGVALVADGRLEPGTGVLVGNKNNTGVGAEIALSPVSGLVQPIVPGATMRGPRPQGFGVLDGRVNNFCAPGDLICDAPRDLSNAIQRARDLISNNAVHAQYATNPAVIPGMTTPEWIIGWARNIVSGQA